MLQAKLRGASFPVAFPFLFRRPGTHGIMPHPACRDAAAAASLTLHQG